MFENSVIRKLYIVIFLSGCLCACCVYLLNVYGKKGKTKECVISDSMIVLPEVTTNPEKNSVKETYDYQSDSSIQRIVNKNLNISEEYVPHELVKVNVPQYATQLLVPEAAKNLEDMFQAASVEGIYLYLVSGYRSYQEQIKLQKYYIDTQGLDRAEKIDCIPGASEHQLGLAVDLSTIDHQYELNTDFSSTQAYEWLEVHSAQYGYILRYPNGKEDSTGIMYSPWNYRYVGKSLAEKLNVSGKTMEEYFELDH